MAKKEPAKTEEKKRKPTRRRGRGEGSIFQREDGLWVGTVSLGYNDQGKRQRRTVYGKTKKEVQDELSKLQSQKVNGTLVKPTKTTVKEYLDKWVEDVRPNVRYTTFKQYRGMVRNHIAPHLGQVVLTKLTPTHISGLYSALERQKVGSRTRQAVHTMLHTAFSQAMQWGLVPRNVCAAVQRPRHRKRQMATWTDKEADKFLKASREDRLYALYVLAITTGMRQGELLGLQWGDLDLKQRTVSVQHNLIRSHDGGFELADPKSASGRRLIHLPKVAVSALHEHRKKMVVEGHAGSAWVFCNRKGEHLRRDKFYHRSYRPLVKRAGVRHIRFHDLRHTCATLLLRQGVNPKVVQERLGHSSISLTLDTYSHVLPEMQKLASEKMDRLFREKTA